jgi:hypothetical protein
LTTSFPVRDAQSSRVQTVVVGAARKWSFPSDQLPRKEDDKENENKDAHHADADAKETPDNEADTATPSSNPCIVKPSAVHRVLLLPTLLAILFLVSYSVLLGSVALACLVWYVGKLTLQCTDRSAVRVRSTRRAVYVPESDADAEPDSATAFVTADVSAIVAAIRNEHASPRPPIQSVLDPATPERTSALNAPARFTIVERRETERVAQNTFRLPPALAALDELRSRLLYAEADQEKLSELSKPPW